MDVLIIHFLLTINKSGIIEKSKNNANAANTTNTSIIRSFTAEYISLSRRQGDTLQPQPNITS